MTRKLLLASALASAFTTMIAPVLVLISDVAVAQSGHAQGSVRPVCYGKGGKAHKC